MKYYARWRPFQISVWLAARNVGQGGNKSYSNETASLSSTLCIIFMISREETVQPLTQG